SPTTFGVVRNGSTVSRDRRAATRTTGYLEQSGGARLSIVEEARMNQVKPSPKIVDIAWGRMEVAGLGVGKDYKLYPGGRREWDWSETGTRHAPGIQPADVEELLAHSATTVVLSQGMDRRLQVDPA